MNFIINCHELDINKVSAFLANQKDLTKTLTIDNTLQQNFLYVTTDKIVKHGVGLTMACNTFFLDGGREFKITKAQLRNKEIKFNGHNNEMAIYATQAVKRFIALLSSITHDKEYINSDDILEVRREALSPAQVNWLLTTLLTMNPFRKYFLLNLIIEVLDDWRLLNKQDEKNLQGQYLRQEKYE